MDVTHMEFIWNLLNLNTRRFVGLVLVCPTRRINLCFSQSPFTNLHIYRFTSSMSKVPVCSAVSTLTLLNTHEHQPSNPPHIFLQNNETIMFLFTKNAQVLSSFIQSCLKLLKNEVCL